MERMMGFEPTTSTLARLRSTPEPVSYTHLCPDLCAELLHSDQIHDVGQVEGLGDGFNGKGGVRGACGQQVSVDSDHGNRQQVGGNLGQSGNCLLYTSRCV